MTQIEMQQWGLPQPFLHLCETPKVTGEKGVFHSVEDLTLCNKAYWRCRMWGSSPYHEPVVIAKYVILPIAVYHRRMTTPDKYTVTVIFHQYHFYRSISCIIHRSHGMCFSLFVYNYNLLFIVFHYNILYYCYYVTIYFFYSPIPSRSPTLLSLVSLTVFVEGGLYLLIWGHMLHINVAVLSLPCLAELSLSAFCVFCIEPHALKGKSISNSEISHERDRTSSI